LKSFKPIISHYKVEDKFNGESTIMPNLDSGSNILNPTKKKIEINTPSMTDYTLSKFEESLYVITYKF
jgi:hypothetical protein